MDDLISRQAAIDVIDSFNVFESRSDQIKLEQMIGELPPANNSEIPNSSDTISRQAAIEAIEAEKIKHGDYLTSSYVGYEMAEKVVKQLPHIQPIQPKRGRWIKLDMHRGMADHKCTACKQECYVPTCMGEPMYAFCPNCGAKMEVNHESN